MGKNLNEMIYKMSKDTGNNKLTIIAGRLKIKGMLPPEPEKYCEHMITLDNVEIYKLREKCTAESCDDKHEPMVTFKTFNIAISNITGFGFCDKWHQDTGM